MLTKEQIDLQNQDGIMFLRNGLVEILEKMCLKCKDEIPEVKKRLSDLQKEYDKLDPAHMEISRTILSNILFFIGSIFAPAVTPSKWFGKQKISEERKNLAKKVRNLTLDFIDIEKSRNI